MVKQYQARQLDLPAFAREQGSLSGRDPMSSFPRLAAMAVPAADGSILDWSVRAELRATPGAGTEPWVHLSARASMGLQCRHCLEPLDLEVSLARWFRFLPDEMAAAREDETSEVDVLVSSHSFDLHALIEDEVILELPMVCEHASCAEKGAAARNEPAEEEAQTRPHPFAGLAALKRELH